MRRDRISHILLIILISMIVFSCQSNISQSLDATSIEPTSASVYLKPLTASWRLVDESLFQQDSSSVAIQAIFLNDQETILFFTLSGMGFEEFVPGIQVQITDEVGHSSKLLKVVPLREVGNLSVGIMVFEPRWVGTQKLFLLWPNINLGEPTKNLVAIFSGDASKEDVVDRTFYASHDSLVEQGNYQISISWGFQHILDENIVPQKIGSPEAPISGIQQTSTPSPYQPIIGLDSGVSVMQECSLVIDDLEQNQKNIINVQLLNNANAIVESGGVISMPSPIIISEPEPYPVPSPYP